MKISPEMLNQNQKIIDLEDLEDKNPEWEKEMKRVEESIRELGELQLEGADTYLSAFAQLKSYPFFRQAAHWFYPFDRQHPDIVKLFTNHKSTEGKSLINLLMESTMFCNSDKYSFCLALKDIPKQQLEMFTAEATEQNQILKEGSEQFAETIKGEKSQAISAVSTYTTCTASSSYGCIAVKCTIFLQTICHSGNVKL